jgi:AAA15 family ATPase/GTPase
MRVKTVRLKSFKRFDDLTIELGESPKKVIALVGPNGCGKSSVFDAFEEKLKDFRDYGNEGPGFFSKALYDEDDSKRSVEYNKNQSVAITTTTPSISRKGFYIRTAYRFTSKLNVKQIAAMPEILSSNDEPISSIALDSRLESNYKRLLGSAYSEFITGKRTGEEVMEELVGKINSVLRKVIDAEISDFGEVTSGKGQLYFRKGNSRDFPYANLSSGEKEVVDIILDLVVKTKEYTETVFCIDEPELHLNTAIQRKLLIEIEKLIPENCQLWVATHSIGFLRALQDELREKSQILDFSEKDYFSSEQVIRPMTASRESWQRIFSTALEDLTGLISPSRIIYCEGRDDPGAGGVERGLDAKVYNRIFSESHNDTLFISSGGNTELDQRSNIALKILTKVFSEVQILVLKDRDFHSGRRATEDDRAVYLASNPTHHRMLERFEIENYLFDKEVLLQFCSSRGTTFDEDEYDSLIKDIRNQNIKETCNSIKRFCGLSENVGTESFKLELAAEFDQGMDVYAELERSIFIP